MLTLNILIILRTPSKLAFISLFATTNAGVDVPRYILVVHTTAPSFRICSSVLVIMSSFILLSGRSASLSSCRVSPVWSGSESRIAATIFISGELCRYADRSMNL